MTISISRDFENLGVLVKCSSLITASDIKYTNEQLMQDDEFARWRYQIWDFSEVTAIEVTPDDMRDIALQDAAAARISPNQRLALIPRKRDGNVRLDRLFHVYEEVWGGYESRTFSSIEAAMEWVLS